MNQFTAPLIHVYIDETGNPMSGKNESELYICTAVVVSDSDKQAVSEGLAAINKTHRGGAPLKSSNVGGRHKLRLDILEDLCKLKFSYLFLITDKSKFISGTPLEKYKRSRYKFLHNKLNKIIEEKNCNLDIVIDEHGTSEFQEECLKYYTRNTEDFFAGEIHHSYADDEKETLLQIADFVGGSLSYCFDKNKRNEYSQQIRDILFPKEIEYDFFPRGCFETIPLPVPEDKLEEELYRHLYNQTTVLLDQLEESDDIDEKMQYYVLNSLFLARCYEESHKQWIYSDRMIKELREREYVISKRTFTVKVIGGLRKKGIIVAGSPNGYKLALKLDDIKDYLLHDSNIIFPMLDKLRMAKKLVLFLVQHNILSGEFSRFDTILKSLGDQKLTQYTDEPDIEKIEMISQVEEK